MSKVRVYELAKEYGVKGPDLAKLLKESGFEKVKSHMAVLDDATELHARAVIEAQGLKRSGGSSDTSTASPGKKTLPKKKALPGEAGADGAPAKKALPEKKPLPGEVSADAPPKKTLPKKKALPTPAAEASATEEAPPNKTLPKPAAETEAAPAKKPLPTAADRSPKQPLSTAAPSTAPVPEKQADSPAAPKAAPEPKPVEAKEAAPQAAPAEPKPAAEAPKAAPLEPKATPAEPKPAAEAPKAAPAEPKPAAEAPKAAPAGPKPAAEAPKAAPAEPAPAPQATPEAPKAEPAAPTPPAAAAAEQKAPATGDEESEDVKKLRVPEQKAKKVGFIELPQEAIRDAKQRSAPNTGRNPGSVGRGLRQRALQNTASRSAGFRGGPGQRRGPGFGRGPGGRGGPRKQRGGGNKSGLSATVDPNKVIEIEPPISVKALSEALGVKVGELITVLTFKLGVLGKNINSFLSPEEIELVALEVKRNVKLVERKEAEAELLEAIVDAGEAIESLRRAPVVTFMGHVDHGKTSLLDALRDSDVTKGEAGGITQHVGAYKIVRPDESQLVILDTPGHEAFTQMRVRGADLTDVVVLVVAADDGVMPQTEEAIAHAKEAKTPIVVAINKCDRPDANPNTVKQQLAVKGLQAEGDWGGDIGMVEVSAHTGQGLDELVERIHLEAEILELDAKPDATGEAVVIESKQTPEQGVTVNVLVTNGTLRIRDQVLCGESLSRIRGLVDDHGRRIEEAGPSTPVSLVGITSLPVPGDKLYVVNDTKKAKEVVDERSALARKKSLAERSANTPSALEMLQQADLEEVKIILKADVMGSLEPIKTSLAKLDTDEVKVRVIHSALGGITETDVSLAEASGAILIGFNAVADQTARQAADRAGVDIRVYHIIYELIDDVKLAMEGKLKPEEVEERLGSAEIKAVFRSSKFGNIAGCMVSDGLIRRNARTRLSRDGAIVYNGTIASLRREKDDVREVRSGFECGLTLKDFNDIKEGDVLEVFDVKLVKRTLD